MATMIDPVTPETVGVKSDANRAVEYPVQVAHISEPVLRLAGTISVIRSGRRDVALSDQEWQDLGLENTADAQ
jgi:hypothetical protein